MAKYKTKVYADFDHFLQYMENSLNTGTAPATPVADYTEGSTLICIRRFDVTAPVKFMIIAGQKGKNEISVEILESGLFYSKGAVEDCGDGLSYTMQNIIDCYTPDARASENSFYRHQHPASQYGIKPESPEIPSLLDKLKKIFR